MLPNQREEGESEGHEEGRRRPKDDTSEHFVHGGAAVFYDSESVGGCKGWGVDSARPSYLDIGLSEEQLLAYWEYNACLLNSEGMQFSIAHGLASQQGSAKDASSDDL